ncbi:MAG: hypothetical protein DELT_02579 [Desulfovibrio sp.]
MKIQKTLAYVCPQCGSLWGSAKFAAECCGPEIQVTHGYKCSCTWIHKTPEEAENCTHGGEI